MLRTNSGSESSSSKSAPFERRCGNPSEYSRPMSRRVVTPPKRVVEVSTPPSMPTLRKVVIPPRKIPTPPPPSIPVLRKVVLQPRKPKPPPEPSTPNLRHVSPIERTSSSDSPVGGNLPMLRPVVLAPKSETVPTVVPIASLVSLKPLTIDNPVTGEGGVRLFAGSALEDEGGEQNEEPQPEPESQEMEVEEPAQEEVEEDQEEEPTLNEVSGLSESADSVESEPQSMTESMNSLTNLGVQEGEDSISSNEAEHEGEMTNGVAEERPSLATASENEIATLSTFGSTTVEEETEMDENLSPSMKRRSSLGPRKSSITLAPTPQGPDAQEAYSNAKQKLRTVEAPTPSLASSSSDNLPSTPQLRHVNIIQMTPKEEIHDFEGTAKHFFKLNADRGDLNAQYYIAKCYLQGKSIAVNKEAAIRYFQLAAEQGHAGAKSALTKLK